MFFLESVLDSHMWLFNVYLVRQHFTLDSFENHHYHNHHKSNPKYAEIDKL